MIYCFAMLWGDDCLDEALWTIMTIELRSHLWKFVIRNFHIYGMSLDVCYQ